jgi:hypothetical protein
MSEQSWFQVVLFGSQRKVDFRVAACLFGFRNFGVLSGLASSPESCMQIGFDLWEGVGRSSLFFCLHFSAFGSDSATLGFRLRIWVSVTHSSAAKIK